MNQHLSRAGIICLCVTLAFGAITGCTDAGVDTPEEETTNESASTADGLYMTDTFSGKVYLYNPTSQTMGSTSIVSTGQNSTGAVYFYKGIGYIAVGSYSNTDPGVYRFNPEDAAPAAARIGDADVSAQFIAFYSDTKAYVSVANYSGTASEQGVYTFNPSSPDDGLSSSPITGTNASGMYLQQIVRGPDALIYVADYNNQKVYVIDPSTDTLSSTSFSASAGGTTALASGSWNGTAGVFVGNVPYSGAGSVDFINTGTGALSAVLPSTAASRLLYISTGVLATTSFTNSYIADVTSSTVTPTEMGSSLAGADLAARDGLVYVGCTDYTTSTLHVFDTEGTAQSYSPLSVMGAGECVAGMAFYAE